MGKIFGSGGCFPRPPQLKTDGGVLVKDQTPSRPVLKE